MYGVHKDLFVRMRATQPRFAGIKDRCIADALFKDDWIRVVKDGIQAREVTPLPPVKDFVLQEGTEEDALAIDLTLRRHYSGIIEIRTLIEASDWSEVAMALKRWTR